MKNYHAEVRNILIRYPATRDDDMMLYAIFCVEQGIIKSDETFYNVLCSAKKRKMPSYETISRARRKIQEMEAGLRGITRKKMKQEAEEYRQFYGNN